MKSYMLPMLQKVGWCIATTYRKTESTKMVYTKIELHDCKKITIMWLQCCQRNHHANDI